MSLAIREFGPPMSALQRFCARLRAMRLMAEGVAIAAHTWKVVELLRWANDHPEGRFVRHSPVDGRTRDGRVTSAVPDGTCHFLSQQVAAPGGLMSLKNVDWLR